MASAGPVDVYVDLAELRRVLGELAGLVAEVIDLDGMCLITAVGGQVGDDVVARNIEWFSGRWRAGRQEISRNLGCCQDCVADAVESYEATEQALSAAAANGVGAASSSGPSQVQNT